MTSTDATIKPGQGQWATGDRTPLNPNEAMKAEDDGLNVRERVEGGVTKLVYVPTAEQVAGVLTKAVGAVRLEQLRGRLTGSEEQEEWWVPTGGHHDCVLLRVVVGPVELDREWGC